MCIRDSYRITFFRCKRYSRSNETTWLQTAGWGTLDPKKNAALRTSSEVVRSLNVKCLPDSSCR